MPTPTLTVLRRGWTLPLLDMARAVPGYYRVAFLGAGLRAGILQRLGQSPATAAELARDLGYDSALLDGLESWLDLGVALRELRHDQGRYGLRSRRARQLVRPSNDPICAYYEEMVGLEHRLIAETPQRLAQGRPFDLGDQDAAMIARSSRMSEPWLAAAIAQVVPRSGPVRLLEVGCGSGAHIREAARLNPQLTVVGLELQEPAADQARANLTAWGLDARVRVEVGDIRDRRPSGDFDLVTLHQNIYYFPEDTQIDLFRRLRGFLRPSGTLLVTSIIRGGGGVGSTGLDLWGAMTDGASRLPVPKHVVQRMRAAGFTDARALRLGIDGMYRAFVATA